jgi:phenylacetate-CoA ligase
MSRLLYYGIERLRTGLRPSDVTEARRVLDDSVTAIRSHVEHRLRKTHQAGSPPLYWLAQQPTVTKDEVRRALASGTVVGSPRGQHWRGTSGSTGVPFRFPKHVSMLRQMDAAMWAVYAWHGIDPTRRQARFWGIPQRRGARLSRRVADRAFSRLRFNAFRIGPEECSKFFTRLREFRPHYAYGYPNLMLRFAKYCQKQGLHGGELGISSVICTGELLTAECRAALAEFFGARIINEYGCSESGILSFECEAGTPHAIPWAVYPELEPPCADGATLWEGAVVLTDLYGMGAPLLRYRLADQAITRAATCSCGRALTTLEPTGGRLSSCIILPDGTEVFSSVLAYAVPAEVAQFRGRQTSGDTLHFEVVARPGSPEEEVHRACEDSWGRATGGRLRIELELVDEIPTEQSGKHRYFIPLSDSDRVQGLD